jgi:hypothetical protein
MLSFIRFGGVRDAPERVDSGATKGLAEGEGPEYAQYERRGCESTSANMFIPENALLSSNSEGVFVVNLSALLPATQSLVSKLASYPSAPDSCQYGQTHSA